MWSSRFFRRFLLLAGFYLIEVTLGARLGLFAPPLVFSAVIAIALEGGSVAGLLWGAAAGLLLEPFASGALGGSSIAYGLTGWCTGALTSKMFGESFWIRTIWPCAALVVCAAIEAGLGRDPGSDTSYFEAWVSALPPQRFIVTAILTPWVVALTRSPAGVPGRAVYR